MRQDSLFWRTLAVSFVFSIFALAYSISGLGGRPDFMAPGRAMAQDQYALNPAGGSVCTPMNLNSDIYLYIWKYDKDGVPISVSIASRERDWTYATYEIKQVSPKR